ncbi:hypothetical protein TYRP_021407 [Tyrophagus putrescentiae]|nr:hypothetical protein TYRP_021407 [Tyrophagus putrescentiae]
MEYMLLPSSSFHELSLRRSVDGHRGGPLLRLKVKVLDGVEEGLAVEAAHRVEALSNDGHAHVGAGGSHRPPKGPPVLRRVVHLHRAERLDAVRAAHGVHFAVVGGHLKKDEEKNPRRAVCSDPTSFHSPLMYASTLFRQDQESQPEK